MPKLSKEQFYKKLKALSWKTQESSILNYINKLQEPEFHELLCLFKDGGTVAINLERTIIRKTRRNG